VFWFSLSPSSLFLAGGSFFVRSSFGFKVNMKQPNNAKPMAKPTRGRPAGEPTKQIRVYTADVPMLCRTGETQAEAVRRLLRKTK
jgi:hypothetical protein